MWHIFSLNVLRKASKNATGGLRTVCSSHSWLNFTVPQGTGMAFSYNYKKMNRRGWRQRLVCMYKWKGDQSPVKRKLQEEEQAARGSFVWRSM